MQKSSFSLSRTPADAFAYKAALVFAAKEQYEYNLSLMDGQIDLPLHHCYPKLRAVAMQEINDAVLVARDNNDPAVVDAVADKYSEVFGSTDTAVREIIETLVSIKISPAAAPTPAEIAS